MFLTVVRNIAGSYWLEIFVSKTQYEYNNLKFCIFIIIIITIIINIKDLTL